ncbi:MAG: tetratricopeptide repeat protein [Deltaproteobacteria bacterium]|nr:tetratricopeptide repeat protein [Deltaproteobacteria bacterium]
MVIGVLAAGLVRCSGVEKKPDTPTVGADAVFVDAGARGTTVMEVTPLPDSGVALPVATVERATVDAGAPVDEPPAKVEPPIGEAVSAEFTEATKAGLEDAKKGIDAFKRLAERNPDLPHAHFNLGVLYERTGENGLAEEAYRSALRAKGDFLPAAEALANQQAKRRGAAEAVRFVDVLVAKNPKSLDLVNLLGKWKIRVGDSDGAVALAKSALRKDERNIGAIMNMGAVFYRQGKTELAIFAFQNADTIDRENEKKFAAGYRRSAAIHQALALSYLKVDNKDAAIAAFREAIALRGDFPEVLNNLAVLLTEKKDFKGAVSLLEKALAFRPGYVRAVVNLGNAHRGLEQLDKALELYEQARKMNPGLAEATFNIGVMYLDHEWKGMEPMARYERAIQEFRRYKGEAGAKLDKDDPVDRYVQEADKRLKIEKRKKDAKERRDKAAATKKAREEAKKKSADDAAKKKADDDTAEKKKAADEAAKKKKADDAEKAGEKKLKRGGSAGSDEGTPVEGRKVRTKDK